MAQVIKGNYNALVWLQDELQTALEQALATMNRYIDESQDEALIVECTQTLFQVKASLEMTNMTGGMMLTEEIQQSLGALRSQSGEEKERSQDVILRALLLMPNYLKLLSHDFEDHPLSLLDNINELRAARQAEPLAEDSLFEADVTIALPDSIAPNPKRKLPKISVDPAKLGQVYQLMLLNWLRQSDVETLRKLLGIVRYLRTSSQQDKAALFWWGAEGMLEAMVQEGIEITPNVKQLTGKLAPVVKTHSDEGESSLINDFPATLFRQLLLMVAKATSHGPQVTLLKITMGLYFFDHRQKIYGMSDNALGDAHQALIEQIEALKPSIDEYAESAKTDTSQLENIVQQLLSMADTLTLLTEYEPSNLIHHQADHLQAVLENEQPASDDDLTELADTLLQVEQLLQGSSQADSEDELRESVLNETLLEMGNIKETLTLMSQGKRDQFALEDTLDQLTLIASSLVMLNYPDASLIAQETHDKVSEHIEQGDPLTSHQLDCLAEVLAASELYMESVRDHGVTADDYLMKAQQTLAEFDGSNLVENEVPPAPIEEDVVLEDTAAITDALSLPTEDISLDAVEVAPLHDNDEADFSIPEDDIVIEGVVPIAENTPELEVADITLPEEDSLSLDGELPDLDVAVAEDDLTISLDTDELSIPEPETIVSTTSEDAFPAPADWQFAEGVDPDIGEVFIEEAQEVMGELDQLLPQWAAGDAAALADIRRYFHTLKGSGRMAGANVIGELAWAVEDVLNKVIDGGLASSDAIQSLTQQTHDLMPALLSQFVRADMSQPAEVDALYALKDACLSPEAEPAPVDTDSAFTIEAPAPIDLGWETASDEVMTTTLDEPEPELKSDTPFTIETEVLTSVEYYIRQKAAETPSESEPVEVAAEITAEPEIVAAPVTPKEVKPFTTVDRYLVAQERAAFGPSSVDDYLTALHAPVVEEVVPAAPKEIKPFTSVDRYLVAQQRAVFGPTSVDDYLTALDAPVVEEVVPAAPKEIKPFTSVDRYLVTQQRAAFGSSSVDDYISALNAPVVEEITPAAPKETKPFTSVDRYLVAQQRAAFGPSSVDNYLTTLEAPVVEEVIAPVEIEPEISMEDQLLNIFSQEAAEHIATLQSSLQEIAFSRQINKTMLRAVHSLKGCANIASVDAIATLATDLDHVMKAMHGQDLVMDSEQMTLMSHVVSGLDDTLAMITEDQITPDIDGLQATIASLVPDNKEAETKVIDPEFLMVFLEETDELLDAYTNQVSHWLAHPWDETNLGALVTTISKLEEVADQAGQMPIAQVYGSLNRLVQQPDPNIAEVNGLLEQGFELLNHHIENLLENKALSLDTSFKDAVDTYLQSHQGEPVSFENTEVAPVEDDNSEALLFDIDEVEFAIPDDVDMELLDAFSEEAEELLNSSGQSIKAWQQDLNNEVDALQLQRDLHTLKGGARLVGLIPMADLTHQIETLVLEVSDQRHPADEAFFDLLQRCQDKLCEMQDQLAQRAPLSTAHSLMHEVLTLTKGEDIHIENRPIPEPEKVAVEPEKPSIPLPDPKPETAQAAPPVEQVRVRADLLDYLSNFAGEVSISSDRITQVHTGLRQQVHEMEDTVGRLHEQLRKLEIETETQILFRYEDDKLKQESEFDPLELDRFSTIQQLSRSLTESVTDLQDITRTMDVLLKDTDSILLQQTRLNNDLQEGLMGTRLLPFSAVTPRLERIVRTTANTLDKKAKFEVTGDSLEIDRTILDRLVAPLEHILRNALAHGIESPSDRVAADKPKKGQLSLLIEREGTEMVVTIQDDGRGLDLLKIRDKAISSGLISPDAQLSDDEVMQLILSSGFSTADSVSQVAGRGVGMDVVNNEIRSLKGRLNIASQFGQGTTFTIRLPLSLSVTIALLVQVEQEKFAIPLNSVYAGERITVRDVKQMLDTHHPEYSYNGEQYDFLSLSKLLDKPLTLPNNLKQQMPLLLFRSGEMRIALLIDHIISTREIVIKSVGPQLGQIAAITGATVLGDGQVVFILDVPILVDTYTGDLGTQQETESLEAELAAFTEGSRVAMVVDDSITMRKASGNLLKRLGFEVMTAKDGVDALSQLHEQKPDVILLDVEMPRMDGFEFASIVRKDEQFRHLPIVMITSRTGQKHRDRAREIGVNDYLGKPYQEDDLIKTLESLLSIQLG